MLRQCHLKECNLPDFARPHLADHHDGMTILLHWLTALLIVALFALAEIWEFLPRGDAQRTLKSLHVSLGVLLIFAVLARLLWRAGFARRLPPDPGIMAHAAEAMHGLLYLLMIVMIVSGPLKTWTTGHGLHVFWLFTIPSPVALPRAWHSGAGLVHNWAAWAIIGLAGLHALAAFFHHYALRDGVLRRILPGRLTPAVSRARGR